MKVETRELSERRVAGSAILTIKMKVPERTNRISWVARHTGTPTRHTLTPRVEARSNIADFATTFGVGHSLLYFDISSISNTNTAGTADIENARFFNDYVEWQIHAGASADSDFYIKIKFYKD